MALYTYGSGASANARPDLAPVTGRYMGTQIADGQGGAGWAAMALAGVLEVPGPGRLTYDGSQFEFSAATDDGIRGINDETAPSEPDASYRDYPVNLHRRGRAAKWSEIDPMVRIREAQMGVAGVEIWQTNRSSNACLRLLDNMLFGASTVAGGTLVSTANNFWAGYATGEGAAADVSATGDQWSTVTADIDADLTEALINYEAATGHSDLDTLVCSLKSRLYLQQNNDLRLGNAINATAGRMSQQNLLGALGGYGIKYLVVVPTGKPLTDQVLLCKAGRIAGRDPLTDFCSVPLCWGRLSDEAPDADGFMIKTWSVEDGQIHKAYVSNYSGAVFPREGGVRITDVY